MTKTFRKIPSNVAVMLDANIVIYALFPQVSKHGSCKRLLERGARGKVRLYMVVNTVADVIHRAMVFEVLAQGLFQKSAWFISEKILLDNYEGTFDTIRDSGFGIRGSGFGVRDSEFGVRDSGFGVRGTLNYRPLEFQR